MGREIEEGVGYAMRSETLHKRFSLGDESLLYCVQEGSAGEKPERRGVMEELLLPM